MQRQTFVCLYLHSFVWKGWARNVIKIHQSYIKTNKSLYLSILIANALWQSFSSFALSRFIIIESSRVSILLFIDTFHSKSTWENPTLRMCNLILFPLFVFCTRKMYIYAKLKWSRRFNFFFSDFAHWMKLIDTCQICWKHRFDFKCRQCDAFITLLFRFYVLEKSICHFVIAFKTKKDSEILFLVEI